MIQYLLLDVFTDRAYAGNPLAVVLDADDLDEMSMRAIANELNLSETVFVGTARPDGAWPTRIFTPQVELPFAGHPTVGAAVALATADRLELVDGRGRCVLAESVGPVPTDIHLDGAVGFARFTVPQRPRQVAAIDPARAAREAGVEVTDLHPGVEHAIWSAGVEFTVVAVRDVDLLARTRPAADVAHLYVIAPVDGEPRSATTWRARMFAPAMGIAEDPATGAAAAATAGLFASLDPDPPVRSWTIVQGVEMGRPSRIEVTVERGGNVHVGGSALIVGSGQLEVPHPEI